LSILEPQSLKDRVKYQAFKQAFGFFPDVMRTMFAKTQLDLSSYRNVMMAWHCTSPAWSDTLTRTNYITVTSGGYTTATRVINYKYDPLSRLTGATYSIGESFEYQYDAVGNRTAMIDTTCAHTGTYEEANRLTSVDGVTYTWDDRGNLVSDGTFT